MRKTTPMASSMAMMGRAFQARSPAGLASPSARAARHTSSPPRTADRTSGDRAARAETAEHSERAARHARNDLALVVGAGLAAALVVASLILLATVRIRQVQAGYRVHDLRTELVKLRQERASLEVERSALLRPSRLAELARARLDLVPVDATRTLRVGTLAAPAHGAEPSPVPASTPSPSNDTGRAGAEP